MSFADKKGIVVASGFKLQAEVLLDARQQVDTIQERDELVTIHAATPGLRVYVKADNTSYVYNGTGWDKLTTGNAYVHPTGDGNHHVPATGTTNNGKVLMAGSTAGSESWQTLTTDDISDFPDSLPTPNNLVVKFNGGASEGNNQFTFNGSAAKTVNITPAAIGASASNHTHTHTSITDFDDAVGDLLPTELPNPEALTISLNGTSQGAYTGSAAKSINITPASIGASASNHTHTHTSITDFDDAVNDLLPTELPNPEALTISLNGTSQGAYTGSASKTVNITPASIGASASNHTHTHTSITDFDDAVGELLPTIPTKLPNPEALTISLNGTSQGAYNGSAAKSINITPASIGAAASSHTHAGTQVTGLTANRAMISNGSGQLAVSAVTSTELGYLDGVTSSIQTQLNGKAASSHTHNYAGSSSAGGAATSANKVNSDLVIRLNGGTTEGSNQFTFNGSGDKTINITPASIGAAASSHGTHVTYGTAAPLANGTASAGSAASVSRSDHVHPLQTTISGNAGSATKLATTRTIDGVSFNGTANITHFGTCSTAAATAAKVVSCTGFTLATGAVITVKFSATNTAASPTLNVNSTGAKAIMYRGSAISAGYLAANRVYTFVYDGTDYELIGDINTDTNTTYSTGTATKAGITKLYTGTGSNTDGTMTQSAITTALNGKAASSHTHTSANITDFEEAVEELLPTIPTKLPNPYTLTFTGAVSTTYDGSAARTVNIPTSGSTDADLVIKLNGGTTEGTNQFTFDGSTAKTVNITASSIGAAARSHTHSTATTSAAGFLRALNGSTANFLRGDGTWATPPNTTYSAMKGATSSAAGSTGLVPAPAAGKHTSFLRGDGTWVVPTNTNTTYTLTKSGSTITLTGSDGSKTSVTDSNTTYSLASFGITATAAELNKLDGVTATAAEINYLDGVTSNIQTQLNGKAASSHTHNYAGSSSAGGAATSANKVNTDLIIKLNSGSTEGTNMFTFNGSAAKTVNITPSAIGAAAASHGTHVSFSTAAPLAPGTASAGSASTVARSDHRHPLQTTITGNAGSATKATQDSEGQVISSTYIKSLSVSGKVITYTKGDGSTGTITTQDTNTTYAAMKGATSSAAGSTGLVPAPTAGKQASYLRGDGTWAVPTNTNTTYTLTKSGSTITLTGSDGKTTSVTDANTTYSLSSFGITATAAELNKLDGVTATATELNYVDGVTSNIQTQLNGKASSSHTHNYAGSSSAGGVATSAAKLSTARTISLSGDASGSVSFNGTANVSIPATVLHHGSTVIPKNANMNSYTDSGWYYCPANATVATLTNCPTTNAFSMVVTQHAGTNQFLIEYMTSSPRIFTRNLYNGTWGAWYEIYHTGQKPTASEIGAAASSHNHSAANITSGTLAVARGGTGITSNPSMLVNLGSTSAASVFATSPRPGITGTLSIAHGGTGATTAAAARSALGAAAASHTHKYAGSSSAGGAATVANKINLPVGTTLFATSSSATFFSATLGGTWVVVGNIDTIVVSSGTALTLYLHRKTAS